MSRTRAGLLGAIAALAFAVVGGLSLAGGTFIKSNITDQLTAQKIAFAPVGSDGLPQDIGRYGGTQVTNGAQAKVFADDYIESHVQGAIAAAAKSTPALVGVTTYSGVSGVSRANPKNAELAALVESTFRGEMLRSSLLNAWGWWTFGVILFWVAIGAFSLAALSALAGGLIGTPVWQRITHRNNATRGQPASA
jgi:hypothetical protein